ncbi:hypothetical protein BBB57_20185 [Kosakonia sacchari]|nr:hypothetical protein BBB57_20185 [Kosakonia sacchari]
MNFKKISSAASPYFMGNGGDYHLSKFLKTGNSGLSQILSMLGYIQSIILTRYDIDTINNRNSIIAWQLN